MSIATSRRPARRASQAQVQEQHTMDANRTRAAERKATRRIHAVREREDREREAA